MNKTTSQSMSSRMSVGTDDYYMARIHDILQQYGAHRPTSPTQILDFLFIGNYRDAEHYGCLRRLGITHVLNCAAYSSAAGSPYPPGSGILAYQQFHADDSETYDIMQHFARARAFIDGSRRSGGKCLVHCAMGINRSGAMLTAYLMVHLSMDLLDAVKMMRVRRGTVLYNRGFQRQLVQFARQRGLL